MLINFVLQQFLDELVWREENGFSASDAFHNIIRDLSAQTHADAGVPLINRLSLVTVDPFKDWSLPLSGKSAAAAVQQQKQCALAAKRVASAPLSKEYAPAVKESRSCSCFATLTPLKEANAAADLLKNAIICQVMSITSF